MSIKNIARLGGVSISTVSKIMNNKASGIADQTKLKVLQIAKELNYTPYGHLRDKSARKYILALICSLEPKNSPYIQIIEQRAAQCGYKLLIRGLNSEPKSAEKAILSVEPLVEGIIYIPQSGEGWIESQVPQVTINEHTNNRSPRQFNHDWLEVTQKAIDYLIGFGHQHIGTLCHDLNSGKSEQIRETLKNHYNRQEITFDHKLVASGQTLPDLIQLKPTAIICDDESSASFFYQYAWENELVIPNEISVMALANHHEFNLAPSLGLVEPGTESLCLNALDFLVAQIEDRQAPEPRPISPKVVPASSVARRKRDGSPILVIGSLNIDVVMTVSQLPSVGETVMIKSLSSLPGGKGANQAIGAAKLGGQVSIIGHIGPDDGGKIIYQALRAHGVNTKAVSIDQQVETGKAYINVNSEGESYIEVYGGANLKLGKQSLKANEELFQAAGYCLIQSELPESIFSQAVEIAHKNKAKVIFKPCGIYRLSSKLLAKIHIIVPNQKEAARLAGSGKSVEEQADFFLDQGTEIVIITLAEHGCYLRTKTAGQYYAAYNEEGKPCVDTSGASDAFISALALALSRNQTLDQAVRFAHVAAGLSVAQWGVQPSLPDLGMMELRKSAYLFPDKSMGRP